MEERCQPRQTCNCYEHKTMAFQFNFDIEQEDQQDDKVALGSLSVSQHSRTDENNACGSVEILRPAKELFASPSLTTVVDTLMIGDIELFYLDPEEVEIERKLDSIRNNSDVSKAIESHSDLIPNVYEGGLKVWECSIDLVHFLHEAEVPLKNKKVLELGCGAGLPGIYAVKSGAAAVHFQDYNEEVLEHMTVPSVMLNKSGDASFNQDLRFFAGDWSLVQEKLVSADPSTKYDIILTSETIYSVESHNKLYEIIRALLSAKGVIYIAAKTHYFGVGGGTQSFEDVVRKRGEFHIEVCKDFTEGVKREILKMVFLETSGDL